MARFTAQQFLHLTLDGRHPGAAADEKDFAQLRSRDAGIPQCILHRGYRPCQQVAGHHLELGAGDGQIEVVGAVLAHSDEGQIELGREGAGQLFLGLFGLFFQASHGGGVAGEVDAVRFLELCHGVFHDALVKVVAAEAGIAAGGQHRKSAVFDLDDGDVEGAAAEVVDQDLLGRFVVKAVGHSGGGRLIDDAQDVQARDAARILGGLALAVVKVSGDGDDGLRHRLTQVALGVAAYLGQYHGADLLRSQVFAVDVDAVVTAHMPLDAGHRPAGVCSKLALCRAAHQTLAVFGERHHAGGGALSLCVGDDDGLAALHHCHAAVRGAKVNTDHSAHSGRPLCFCDAHIFPSISYRFRMTIS